jgi:NAD(P)-dependent dehydrogenase (short-subunit alcohol dehydrogenase family)
LLTRLLLEVIKHTAQAQGEARVVNVSSEASRGGRIDFDDLQGKRKYFGWTAYSQSKLANILFTNELAKRIDGGVTVNALHPGFVATKFGHNNGALMSALMRLTQVFAKTPQQGAETPVVLASSPLVSGKTGGYYIDSRLRTPPSAAENPELAARLWQVSEELTDN